MKKTIGLPFLALVLVLFCWINLPKSFSDHLRSKVIRPFKAETSPSLLAQLQHENQALRAEIERVYEWVLFDKRIKEGLDSLGEIQTVSKKRAIHLAQLLKTKLLSLPAEVVYRDPNSWSSSLWVNVGHEDNQATGKTIVGKNSPVLSDGALVGVVEFVGPKQSRIRLITDSGLCPSVRVSRGSMQNRELNKEISSLLTQLEKRSDLFPTDAAKKEFIAQLNSLSGKLSGVWEDGYLAKGEVHGSSAPFWRSRAPMLKGVGFNFGFADADSSPADVTPGVPILKEGDLLVTSGLDGVFPQGLPLGTVAKVAPLKPGKYAYDIEVRPMAAHLNDLQALLILPPIE